MPVTMSADEHHHTYHLASNREVLVPWSRRRRGFGLAPLARSTLLTMVFQGIMIGAGHFNSLIRSHEFGLGSGIIALLGALLHTVSASAPRMIAALGEGAFVGGVSGFACVLAASLLRHDPASVVGLGTAAATLGGLLGGLAGWLLARRPSSPYHER